MKPRIILIVVAAALMCFGFVMIYSASSITAMSSSSTNYDPAYYLKRQVFFAIAGIVLAFIIGSQDYHLWSQRLIYTLYAITLVLLAVVFSPIAGQDAYGASRWISIGPFTLQPSEFAKITVVLMAANLASQYYDRHELDGATFAKRLGVFVGVPLVMILVQPDKGSTIIIAISLLVMAYLAGMDRRLVIGILVLGAVGVVVMSLKDDYSRQRILTMLDPWEDPYGSGYQLIQGFYAFGSGGLFGVGIGMSRQKYSYLPMAYNDFIYAVIGEECGLVGTLGVLVGFGIFAWAGFRIARYAPDMCGRLIAAGCTSLIIVQLLVNVCGVLGIIPLSGKPIPFLSYGGSTIISCVMIVGMLVSVSRSSSLPETDYERSRRSWQMARGDESGEPDIDGSFVGTPTPRSSRYSHGSADYYGSAGTPRGRRSLPDDSASDRSRSDDDSERRRSFRVVSGGASRSGSSRSGRSARSSTSAGRRERIDLGPSATERLRGSSSSSRRSTRNNGRGDRRDR